MKWSRYGAKQSYTKSQNTSKQRSKIDFQAFGQALTIKQNCKGRDLRFVLNIVLFIYTHIYTVQYYLG